ncbi:MAG: D-alanyl-D-alanine carboxypeptidase/D-alanyl-D-alanine-endopeptidase [Verrucomicrobiota bacterium]|nr:D-alanyl-D-alanine carboxypeptidase/D-alanyl-D-alanine-endopeptidase [Verrucomicrobiota bacterium]
MRTKAEFPALAKIVLAAVALWCAANSLFSQETNRIPTLGELRQKISTLLAQPRFDGALWGVKIVSLDTGKTVYESHAERLMSPASNCKLFTAALALDRFGGDYRIATPIYATVKPNRFGTLHGDLIVVGRGDPTWNRRRFGTNFWDLFDPFVSALTNAGVRRVTGDLIADATYFRGEPTGGSLMMDDFQNGECPYISALTINDGLAQVRVTPGMNAGAPCRLTMMQPDAGLVFSNRAVTVASNGVRHVEYYMPFGAKVIYVFGQLPLGDGGERLDIPDLEPARWFGAALKEALARHGIRISGRVRALAWPQTSTWNPATAVMLGEVPSPPLREVIRLYMKPSENLENDIILADIGEAARDAETPPWRSSQDLGLAALHQFLATNDMPSDEVHFDEGSGLSDDNLTTANALVALLEFMARHHEARAFINALPVAGVDGTLRHRMRGTSAAGNVRAKTGTLWWSRTLSGYVTSAAGEQLAFSLLLNRYAPPPGRDGRAALDAIAETLADFSGRSTDGSAALEKTYAPFGRLILAHLTNAPFPDPARARGYAYHGKFYSARAHYSDNTVAIFIPQNFRAADKVDFVVHFHGWNHTVAGALPEYRLIEQFAGSGKNAILVVPQGPYDAPDSFGGKLEDTNGFKRFMNEVVGTLKSRKLPAQTDFGVGNIILSAHSGGYHVLAAILDHGGLGDRIREAWLFDALYGGTEKFVAWQKKEHGRLVDLYTDHGGTKQETEHLMASLKTNGVRYFAGEDINATPEELRTNRWIFLHSALAHNDVVAKRDAFEQFLESSCLSNK